MNLQEACHDKSTARRRFTQPQRMAGFTLTELLLVVALTGIAGAYALPLGLSFVRIQTLNETSENLVGTMRKAQHFSITGRNESVFGVRILSDTYVLFEGDSYAERNIEEDEEYPLPNIVSVSGPDEITFSPFTGQPSIEGSVIVSVQEEQRNIVVSPQGHIGL